MKISDILGFNADMMNANVTYMKKLINIIKIIIQASSRLYYY